MDAATFRAKNTVTCELSKLRTAYGSYPPKRVAWFEKDDVLYYAVKDKSAFDPIYKLFGTGYRRISINRNYDDLSDSESGAQTLMGGNSAKYTSKKINSRCSAVKKCDIKVTEDLARRFPVLGRPGGVVRNLQDETPITVVTPTPPSAEDEDESPFDSVGNCNIHRYYLATAYTVLHKKHAVDRDGVVALIADSEGRIISWGQKNSNVPCWHGETSAIMRLDGKIPNGACVYSTLKPCKMCSGLIKDSAVGSIKVFWGQDDPGSMAENTVLETERLGRLLDGNKSHAGARGILLKRRAEDAQRVGMAETLDSSFRASSARSTIDYVVTPEAEQFVKAAETTLKNRSQTYETSFGGNEDMRFVLRYLTDFLRGLNISVDSLG